MGIGNLNILTLNDERMKIRNFIHDQLIFVKGIYVIEFTFTDDDNLFELGLNAKGGDYNR